MRTLHLFAGAGGGLLADLILGHQPVAAVERNTERCKVLRRSRWFSGVDIIEGDVRDFRTAPYKGKVDGVCAGFPCQPYSIAGRHLGAADDRNLWPEVERVIRELRPKYAFLENVPALLDHGYFGEILGSLAALGYDVKWDCIPASAVGAPQVRDRLWILATEGLEHAASFGQEARKDETRSTGARIRKAPAFWEDFYQCDDFRGRSGRVWRAPVSAFDGVDYGLASEMDRLEAIGNAQCPLQAAYAWICLGGPVT